MPTPQSPFLPAVVTHSDYPVPTFEKTASQMLLETETDILTPSDWQIFAGRAITVAFALGTGITGVGGLAKAIKGTPFYVSAPILFAGSVYSNYKLVNKEVIAVITLGPKGIYEGIKGARLLVMVLGTLFATLFGIGISILTRDAGVTLPDSLKFLSALGKWIEIPADFFAGVTFFALTALMTKTVGDLVQSKDLIKDLKNIFATIFSSNSVIKRSLIGVAIGLMSAAILSLVVLGQTDTLAACEESQKKLIMKFKSGIERELNIIEIIATEALPLIIQLPFTFKTVMKPILFLFLPKKKATETSTLAVQHDATDDKATTAKFNFVLMLASLISSIGSAFIALSGKNISLRSLLGAIGAALNTLFGSVGNNFPDIETTEIMIPGTPQVTDVSSTNYIHRATSAAGLDEHRHESETIAKFVRARTRSDLRTPLMSSSPQVVFPAVRPGQLPSPPALLSSRTCPAFGGSEV